VDAYNLMTFVNRARDRFLATAQEIKHKLSSYCFVVELLSASLASFSR